MDEIKSKKSAVYYGASGITIGVIATLLMTYCFAFFSGTSMKKFELESIYSDGSGGVNVKIELDETLSKRFSNNVNLFNDNIKNLREMYKDGYLTQEQYEDLYRISRDAIAKALEKIAIANSIKDKGSKTKAYKKAEEYLMETMTQIDVNIASVMQKKEKKSDK